MRRIAFMTTATAVLCLLLGGVGCVMEERIVEVVVTGETCLEFEEDHDTAEYTTPVTVYYGDEIDEILEDEGLSREDILAAKVMSATYQVTSFDHSHDWRISGHITVEYAGSAGPVRVIEYTDQSLLAAQPAPVPAVLDTAGVSVLNEAFQDYLDGAYPILVFEVNNGSVEQEPSEIDPLVFTWEACIKIHVLYQEELEVPDPL